MPTATTTSTATLETESTFIEVTMELDLYCTESEPCVGYRGGCEPDGYRVTEVLVTLDDEVYSEWQSTSLTDCSTALAFIALDPELDKALEACIEKANDDAANDFEPGDDFEPDWDAMRDARSEALEWGGVDR